MSVRTSRPVGTALWLQIEATLSQEILGHQLTGRLPNEQALAERFQVNRHTVRQAIQSLQHKGLVRIERGRGTFVQEDMIAYRLGKTSRFSHSLAGQHLVSDVDIQSCHFEPASAPVAALLAVAAASPVLRVESLDLADGKVVSVCTQYFPLPRFDGLIEVYRTSKSTSEAFSRLGITRFNRVLSRISARLPRPAGGAGAECRHGPAVSGAGQQRAAGVVRYGGDCTASRVDGPAGAGSRPGGV